MVWVAVEERNQCQVQGSNIGEYNGSASVGSKKCYGYSSSG